MIVKDEIMAQLESMGLDVEAISVKKGMAELTGVKFKQHGPGISPVVYLDGFSGDSKEIAEQVADILKNTQIPNIDLDNLKSKETILTAQLRLAPTGTLPEDVVYKESPLEGIDVYASYVTEIDGGQGSIKVTRHLIEENGISEDELFEAARKNTEKEFAFRSYTVTSMGIVPLPTISNLNGDYGAASILCEEKMADVLNDKMYTGSAIAIPSSVNEMILLPMEVAYLTEDPAGELSQLIKDVNNSDVHPVSRLGESAYVLTANGKEVTYQTAEDYFLGTTKDDI